MSGHSVRTDTVRGHRLAQVLSRLFLLLFTISGIVCLMTAPAWSANSEITGTVLDGKSGQGLIGASVLIKGTTMGAACDLNGVYTIRNVPPGTYTLAVSSIGYNSKEITELTVKADEIQTIDASLSNEAMKLETVKVTAERARATESAMLIRRKTSLNVTDGLSAEMISRSGDSDAGDALKRIVGVSVVDNKNLVVRGMGGRYSNVQMNGSPIPSPEPEKREVPLDMFPGGVLEEVVASKTVTPDKPASFSGGTVDLKTREYPSRLSIKVSSTGSYNSVTTGSDILGYNRTLKGIPSELQNPNWQNDPNAVVQGGLSIANHQWTPSAAGTAPLNSSYSVSIGSRMDLTDDGAKRIGILASLKYGNSYTVRQQTHREARAVGLYLDYDVDRTSINDSYSGLVNFGVSLSMAHQLTFRGFYSEADEKEAMWSRGWTQDNGSVQETRIRYVTREITSGQVSGEHEINWLLNSKIEWRTSLATANRDEPTNRMNAYTWIPRGPSDSAFFWSNDGWSGISIFVDHEDRDANGALDWTLPLWTNGANLKFGGFWQYKDRDLVSERFRFKTSAFPSINNFAESLFVPATIESGKYKLASGGAGVDDYTADEHATAGYFMLQTPIYGGLRVIGGMRYEDDNLTLRPGNAEEALLHTYDWFPMASLVMRVGDRMNFRGAYSQTIGRPEYREMVDFQFQDFVLGRARRGNPDLKPSYIQNFDLRWEVFPRAGEIFSVSFFYKKFEDAIEEWVDPKTAGTTHPQLTYINVDHAENKGVELEVRKSLDFGGLSQFMAGASTTFIDSKIEHTVSGTRYTFDRPLTGQSDFVLNLILAYSSKGRTTQATMLYNSFGDRILELPHSISQPPYKEQTRHQLDFTLHQKLYRTVKASLVVQNILGAKYEVKQEHTVLGDVLIDGYDIGRTVSLGVSYEL